MFANTKQLLLTYVVLFGSTVPSLVHADVLGYVCADQACNQPFKGYDYSILNNTRVPLPFGSWGWKAMQKGGRVCRELNGHCTDCNPGNWHTGCWPSGQFQWQSYCSL